MSNNLIILINASYLERRIWLETLIYTAGQVGIAQHIRRLAACHDLITLLHQS
jgi:hypothetical protein